MCLLWAVSMLPVVTIYLCGAAKKGGMDASSARRCSVCDVGVVKHQWSALYAMA
ncbi:hypothetical protein PF005_g13675 [Phytophthora fragariae]|uniref:Uncharacterized protein n=1 Tax=Phytophthora fragariae TaxID=53985 RepID=A0A6A3HBX6_9STRA|nr:hypothetical protein PF003_g30803 [Phytophthora fragariae]KAE8919657.1 hypothetical protein PF009_g30040 [Phytophthora fragariae]KAE8967349.1 hypothetical protein PF011_g27586 [Phytophthora fragariae]KAE9063984.1 hypothetical protein PF010_g28786 [Phytophthora fragariae]KAE9068777.1 hypothetical protein PF006_g29723 [Phytophthora fragariae]